MSIVMGTTLLVVAYGFVIMHVLSINIETVLNWLFFRFPNESLSYSWVCYCNLFIIKDCLVFFLFFVFLFLFLVAVYHLGLYIYIYIWTLTCMLGIWFFFCVEHFNKDVYIYKFIKFKILNYYFHNKPIM
jgi:hypothetical protein